jgi:hypothetical protein
MKTKIKKISKVESPLEMMALSTLVGTNFVMRIETATTADGQTVPVAIFESCREIDINIAPEEAMKECAPPVQQSK